MTIVSKMSRIGKLPIVVPDKVKVTLEGNAVSVKVGLANDTAHTLPSDRSYSIENIILERMYQLDAQCTCTWQTSLLWPRRQGPTGYDAPLA